MEKLYTLLTNKLKTIHPNVGFEYVSSNTSYPYITYQYVNATPLSEGDREDIIVEVDIWNSHEDGKDAITEIETITKQIENMLKDERYHDGVTFFLFHLINKINIPDSDRKILRRQLRFRVRSYY